MGNVLGISCFYHDSAAAIVINGKIEAAAQEERFTRIKHTSEFPEQAIRYCLEHTGLQLHELDAVVFYDKPLLKFERLLETYYAFAPRGIVSFLKAMPVWINDKLFLKNKIRKHLSAIGGIGTKQPKLLFSEHHLSHAASAFYPSNFESAAILTIDGVGEWTTASIAKGENSGISILKEMKFPHSVGLLYSAFTYYLGFKVNSGEYKMMGLAPYGNAEAVETKQYISTIKSHLVSIKNDGSIYLHQAFFNYATGLQMVNEKKWQTLFGFKRRIPESELLPHHCNLALAIQTVTEEIVLKMATEAKRLTGSDYLCMAGGVALNCVANGKLKSSGLFKEIFIQPAAGDAGAALGAAMAATHLYFNTARHINSMQADAMQGSYLGPDFSDKEIEQMAKKMKAVYKHCETFSELTATTSALIANGKVVGWFQDRMEFGPRSLGNRSILADAQHSDMQKKLNMKVKQREGFRPFAPAVLEEDREAFFELSSPSPYMLLTGYVKPTRRVPLPIDVTEQGMWDKLYCERSDIPAVTHLDFSARVQTVSKTTNPKFWELLNAYKVISGKGLLINTSFNVRGEPPVCNPDDAYRCFMATEIDYLVIGNYLFKKEEQPAISADIQLSKVLVATD
ncbi:MAG: carbamoyltransferase [Bacteroidota bacterium]